MGSLIGTFDSPSNEPTGITYNPSNQHLFVSDDNRKRVSEIDPGNDGLYDTNDDIVTHKSSFGSTDPEGVTYDAADGALHVVDGIKERVYTIDLGADGSIGGGDDSVTSFGVGHLGIKDPEGIAWDADNDMLYIIASSTEVAHITKDGSLVRMIDISEANAHNPAGLAIAPTSNNPNSNSLYIVDRGVDNNSGSNYNDGKVYEFLLPPLDTLIA